MAVTGCRHLAFEHLKLPLERSDNAWSTFPTPGSGDIYAHYRRQRALRDGRELVLPASAKLAITLRVRTLVHQHGMSFGAADNELQYLSDGACCCSGVDRFPGFENFFRHQIGFALHKSLGRAIRYSAISREWAPHGSIDRYLNSRSRLSGRTEEEGSLSEHVRARWNDPAAPGSPASFFGVVASDGRDSSGNIIYFWVADSSTCST
jgi:hypothetical protein